MKASIDRGEIRRISIEFDEKDIKEALLLWMKKYSEHLLLPMYKSYKVTWDFDSPFTDSCTGEVTGAYTVTYVQSVEITQPEVQP